ncbi:MAG: UDP-2,3-diacylglucosamine diphosphatase [Bacteroidia bacterium]
MKKGKKIYFASDFHLGAPDYESSLVREKRIIRWLEEARKDAEEIYLLGDVFDFWFEYQTVVPRGFVRLLGKLAEISDSGIPVHFFTGNHDMWITDYLPTETGVIVHKDIFTADFAGKKFYMGHGDGLGPGDKGYKFIKMIFSSSVCHWLFSRLHPNFGVWFARFCSKRTKEGQGTSDEKFLGEDKEWLIQYSKEILKKEHYDYFVFGHRHLPLDVQVGEKSRYINLGDWIGYNTYAVFDGETMELKKYSESAHS